MEPPAASVDNDRTVNDASESDSQDPAEIVLMAPAAGMESWILRNGLLPKKAGNDNRQLRMSRNVPGAPRTCRKKYNFTILDLKYSIY